MKTMKEKEEREDCSESAYGKDKGYRYACQFYAIQTDDQGIKMKSFQCSTHFFCVVQRVTGL